MSPVIARPFLARLEDLASDGQRKLLGLVGPPGGGKSTLAQALLAALPGRAVVVPMDGFHLANAELSRLDAHWARVREQLDEVWFVDTDDALRRDRLV